MRRAHHAATLHRPPHDRDPRLLRNAWLEQALGVKRFDHTARGVAGMPHCTACPVCGTPCDVAVGWQRAPVAGE